MVELDPAVVATVSSAAGTIVGAMAQGVGAGLRERIEGLLRRGSEEERAEALQAYEDDLRALEPAQVSGGPEVDSARQAVVLAEKTAAWTLRLASFLAAHPEVRPELLQLSASVAGSPVYIQSHSGSGTFVGRDVNGGITIHNGGGDTNR